MAHEHEVKLSDADLKRCKELYSRILEIVDEIDGITGKALTAAHPEAIRKIAGKPTKGITISPDWFLRKCVGSGEGMCTCQDFNKGVCRICSSEE